MTDTLDRPLCIYVASRLTADHPIDYLNNLQASIEAGAEIWRKGHFPYIPGIDFILYMNMKGDYGLGGKMPYNASLEWMRRCDAVLWLNGLRDMPISHGVSEIEWPEAQRVELINFFSLDEIPEVRK